MGRQSRARKERKAARAGGSSLEAHRRHKKELIPPLMQGGEVHASDFRRDALPDLLWIAAVADATKISACHVVLDLLDEFAPERAFFDGHVSSFAQMDPARRSDAKAALRARTPGFVLPEFASAMSCYPESPMAWMFESIEGEGTEDPPTSVEGLVYLRRLVGRMLGDHRGAWAAQLRMIPLGRTMKHGRMVFHSSIKTVHLLPKYPTLLTPEECLQVEAFTRSTYQTLLVMRGDESRRWAEYFWRNNWKISACDQDWSSTLHEPDEDIVADESGEPGAEKSPETGEPAGSTPSVRSDGFRPDEGEEFFSSQITDYEAVHAVQVAALDALGVLTNALEELQVRAVVDTYDPVVDEVRLGIAARQLRLFRTFVEDSRLWCDDIAPVAMRPAVETRIIGAWLLKRADRTLYQRMKDFGQGKLKLYKLHLQRWLEANGATEADEQQLNRAHAEVNAEKIEELQKIDFGSVFSVDIRKMSEETGLKHLYDLLYQSMSAEMHGEWQSIARFDLRACANPLHRNHRVGAFSPNPVFLDPMLVRTMFLLTRDLICQVFDEYKLDARPAFAQFFDHFRTGAARESGTPSGEVPPPSGSG